MKARKTIVLGAGLIGVIVLCLLFIPRRPYLARQTLSDGTTLTLVAVKAGQKHEPPVATFKQKLAARLPASWRARFKLATPLSTFSPYSSNYLSVWLTAERTNAAGPPRFRVLIGDDQDNFCIHLEQYPESTVSTPLGSNAWLVGLPATAWPRRAETIRIQVYTASRDPMFRPGYGDQMLAEFRVKNPGRDTTTPAWTAPPWPITVRDGELDFTLTSLWLGLEPFGAHMDPRLSPLQDPSRRWTRATFRVTRGDEVLTNWNAYRVREIVDATGNWADGNEYLSLIRDGEAMNHFKQQPLPAGEAWRMTVEFARVSGFSAEELRTVTGIPLPPAGQGSVTKNLGTNLLKVSWERRLTEDNPLIFRATVYPVPSDHILTLVRATDNLGRALKFKNVGGDGGVVFVAFEELNLAPNATSVDLVFALHRNRLVKFQVKPEFYRRLPK